LEFAEFSVGKNSQVDTAGLDPIIARRIHLDIGDNCFVKLSGINVINQSVEIVMHNDATLEFDQGQSFNGACRFHLLEPSKVSIGSGCLWSSGLLTTSDYHSILDVSTGKRINYPQDVTIGNRVWFGVDFLILKGTSIGNDSVIAAKSVVTSGIYEDNVLLAGNPARVVRKNIYWDATLMA